MTEQLTDQESTGVQTLNVPGIPEAAMRRLDERAHDSGMTPADYARSLIVRELERPTLDEILAPIRQGFSQTGLTDEGLTELFEEARDEVWEDWQRKGKP